MCSVSLIAVLHECSYVSFDFLNALVALNDFKFSLSSSLLNVFATVSICVLLLLLFLVVRLC